MKHSGILKYMGNYTGTILACIAMLALACSKDLGNYDYEDANAIHINTTKDSFAVRQNDTLHIAVNLQHTQGSTNLSYRWYLIQNVASNPNPPIFELDSTKDLNIQVLVVPGFYKVVNKVTDLNTGVSFYKYFKLNVLPAPWGGEGWLVLQDQAALHNGCDVSIILSRDGATHGDVYHNLYQQANNRKLPLGTNYMSVINHTHTLMRQKLMFAYPGGGTEVKAIDYSDSSYAENWFLNQPSTLNVQFNGNIAGAQREIIINNNQLHYRAVNLPNLSTGLPILFGAPLEGTWELSPMVMQFATLSDMYVLLYDKKNRSFVSMNIETNVMVPNRPDVANQHYLAYSGNAANLLPTSTGFDMNYMRNNLLAASNLNQIVLATNSSGAIWNCFFRNDAADSTWIVQVTAYLAYNNNNSTGRYYLNPARCPGINEARLFANPKFLAAPGMFYYANNHQVFTCNISSSQGNSSAVPGYTFPDGTIIKAMKVFESGYSGPSQRPNTPFPATEGRVLVVATDETASGGGNNVYFININNNGSLQTTYADKYTGFDKIIDIQFKKDVNL